MIDPAQESTTPISQPNPVFDGGGNNNEQQLQQPQQSPQPQQLPPTQQVVSQQPTVPQSDQVNFRQQAQSQRPQEQAQVQPQAEPQQQPQNQNELTPPNQQEREQYREQYDPYNDPYYQDYPLGPVQEELLYDWKAPSRPFKQHNRQYYTTVGTIVLLVVLILFFAGQILPIAVVLAVGFLVYVLTSIPPHTILNQITTYGIRTADNLYYWDELGRFWFKKKYNDEILHIEVARFPERLTLLIGEGDKQILREILSLTLLEQEPLPTYYERAAQWLQEKIPLDIES